jgi:hypothetical protein
MIVRLTQINLFLPRADIQAKEQISEFDPADISTIMLLNAGKPVKPLPLANPEVIQRLGLVPVGSSGREMDNTMVSTESVFQFMRAVMGLSGAPQSSAPVRPPLARKPLDEPILNGSKPKAKGGLRLLKFNGLSNPVVCKFTAKC